MSRISTRAFVWAAAWGAVASAVAITSADAQQVGAPPAPVAAANGAAGAALAPRPPAVPLAKLPDVPTAVTLPTWRANTGPGAMYETALALWPGRDMDYYHYVADEYLVSGNSDGQLYTARLVIRHPADMAKASGLVVAESMHPSGGAHAFEYDSVYVMSSGHVMAEISTNGWQQFAQSNPERYKDVKIAPSQGSDILAQVGALLRSPQGPLAGHLPRHMVLWGTSASSAVLVNYLPAHRVWRTPDMQRIYDGFVATSNGSNIPQPDVPMIQVPTMHEYGNVATAAQDSDDPAHPYRVYEFAGMGHLPAFHNEKRLPTGSCEKPISTYPMEAYMSVALHHLLQWVDKGIVPPRAPRVVLDMWADNDGSLMALDAHGNPQGGIRSPYLDVPVATYTARNTVVGGGAQVPGVFGPALLCNLSAWEARMTPARLKVAYGTRANYVKKVEASLAALEKAGWSLPVYHELILADARSVAF
jgi:hypothetical protein